MALQLAALAIVSLIAHLEHHAILWMIAGAMSIFTGFYWYDTFGTNLGLTFGLCFLVYGLVCWQIAFVDIFTWVKNKISQYRGE